MSRIGKNPVANPAGVEVTVGEQIVVKGPLGTLKTSRFRLADRDLSVARVFRKNKSAHHRPWLIVRHTQLWKMYFLLAVLNQPGWRSSVVFPVNNIAVVAVSCLVAMVLFKEKLSKLNLTGIALSMLAISLIMQSM